jgi:hypothetical protein
MWPGRAKKAVLEFKDLALIISLSRESNIFTICTACYQKYYNEVRRHLTLKRDAPIPREVQRAGPDAQLTNLGGLHHRYVRV